MRSRLAEWLLVPFLLLPVAIGAALWLYAERQWRAEIEPYFRDGEGAARAWVDAHPEEAARARDEFLRAFGPGGDARPDAALLVPFTGPAGEGEVLLGEHALGRDPWTLSAGFPGGLSAAALADPSVRLEIEKGVAAASLDGVDAATVAFRDLATGPDLARLRTAPLPAATKRFLVRRWIAGGAEDPRLEDAERLLDALAALDRGLGGAFGSLAPGDHPSGEVSLIASGGVWPVLALPEGPRSIAGASRWVADLGRVRLRLSSPRPARGPDAVWSGRLERPVAAEFSWVEKWHSMGDWPVFTRWAGPAAAVLAALFLLPLALLVSLRKRRRLDEARSRFINELAHDLRTPLTSLRLYAEMLAEGRAPEAEKERYVSVLARESARLSSLLGNLLDLSRLERGAREFTPEQLEMDEAAETAIGDFAMLYPDRADDLKVSGPDDLVVSADRAALSRCLANLLDNAGKFTGQGTPIRVSWRGGDRGRVLLVVADDGPGIPEGEERRLFVRYARGARAMKDGVPGSGLGLSLVRELVEGMEGRVRLLPSDKGAAFEIDLPEGTDD